MSKKANKASIKECILDIGLNISSKGNRLYALLKGVLDGGLKIPVSEEILPDEKRIKGEHIASHRKDATDITKLFDDIKNKIMKGE